MCDVPSLAVFCSESIECFPGTASKFFFRLLVTIPVAPILLLLLLRKLWWFPANSHRTRFAEFDFVKRGKNVSSPCKETVQLIYLFIRSRVVVKNSEFVCRLVQYITVCCTVHNSVFAIP